MIKIELIMKLKYCNILINYNIIYNYYYYYINNNYFFREIMKNKDCPFIAKYYVNSKSPKSHFDSNEPKSLYMEFYAFKSLDHFKSNF